MQHASNSFFVASSYVQLDLFCLQLTTKKTGSLGTSLLFSYVQTLLLAKVSLIYYLLGIADSVFITYIALSLLNSYGRKALFLLSDLLIHVFL